MGNKAPSAPDYKGAAAGDLNSQRPNQNTGTGSIGWSQDPKTGQWTQTSSLNGALSGAQGDASSQYAANLKTKMDDGVAARDKATSQVYSAEAAQLDPQWRLKNQQSDAQLANQGLDPTSAASRAQHTQMSQDQNQAYSQARSNAEQIGNQAQQITYGENLQSRELPMQELQGMLGLENQQGYQGTPEQLTAAMGQGNYGLAANQQNNALAGSIGSGIGSMAGAAMGAMSDERVKENIERREEEAIPGVPMATWEYKGQPGQKYAGVIAQDLEKVAPKHVQEDEQGLKHVSPTFQPFALG